MKKLLLSIICISSIFAVSCAKQREIEKLKNPENDWYQKEVFTGTKDKPSAWLYKATVVNTSNNNGFAFVGYQSDAKAAYFRFTKDNLELINANNVLKKESANTSNEVLNKWSIKHKDVRLGERDKKPTNKEKEEDEKVWKDKRSFTIDFSKAVVSEAATFPYSLDMAQYFSCWSKKSAQVIDKSQEITKDYISFVVQVDYQMNTLCPKSIRRDIRGDFTYSVQYRYSFKRLVETNYKPFIYKDGETDPLLQKFGYFNTYREGINEKDGRHKTTILMNRWNPTKEHHYYFTKDFPEEHKWMFTDPKIGIFARTNKIFEENGLKTRFHIHENTYGDGKVKNFGDIRYSFVNFIEEMDSSAPFGYGPSDANPFTGEIVAANLVVWTGYLKYYMKRVQDTIKRRENKESSSLYVEMKDTLKQDPKDSVTKMNFGDKKSTGTIFHNLMQSKTYGYPYWARFTSKEGDQGLAMSIIEENQRAKISSIYSSLNLQGLSRQELIQQKDLEISIGKLMPSLNQGLFNREADSKINNLLSKSVFQNEILDASKKIDEAVLKVKNEIAHEKMHLATHGTVFPIESALSDATQALIDGETYENILKTILYRVSIHEFGHNLNLRHNFYGSVDVANFPSPKKIANPDGSERIIEGKSSSVMEYLSIADEIHLKHEWESYDKAAIAYAYSDGKIESKKKFLFCTDEHRILNAMCNTFDLGATPSEVLMSMIDQYDDLYNVVNYRNDRAYWNTAGYQSYVFRKMWDIKRFLLMWRTDYTESKILAEMKAMNELSDEEKKSVAKNIDEHMQNTVKLSLAFYNSVIQQSAADRPWRDVIDEWSGSKKRIGILFDKVFAMLFLVGDDGFMYDPNRNFNTISYLTYANEPILKPYVQEIYENAITSRVDMDSWFLGYSRALFGINATSYSNTSNASHIRNIKIDRFTAEELDYYFKIKPARDFDIVVQRLKHSTHPDYRVGMDEVGITKINGKFYMTNKSINPYAYSAIHQIYDGLDNGSIMQEKMDFLELYNFYKAVRDLE